MAPSLALTYSSSTVDGVVGDVQAPWVGMGWNIDTAEISRKITNGGCNPCNAHDGSYYGFEDKFILTFNGSGGELIPDGNTGRYHTKNENFLYIQMHSARYGNQGSAPNDTGEWWEIVTKDGTRWRLGYTSNSEQLADMLTYRCDDTCTGPDYYWRRLGFVGKAPDRVAARWRVDLVTDTYGNWMKYTYREEPRQISGSSFTYDKASYIYRIDYSGYGDPDAPSILPQYFVVFNRLPRPTETHYDEEVPPVLKTFRWVTQQIRLFMITMMSYIYEI